MFRFPISALRGWSATVATVGIIAAAFFAFATPASLSAQDNIRTTMHNFSLTSTRSTVTGAAALGATFADYGEVCVYCHTPHGGSTAGPLWNRGASGATYLMYTVENSATMDMVVGAAPGAVSLACLSCHDGTLGLDVITNVPNTYVGAAATGAITMATLFPTAPGSFKNLGADLRNDHPIAVTFNTALDAAYNTQASIVTAGLPFYGTGVNQIECGTCHNVHNGTNVPFLRIANTASALCTTCHIK